MISTIAWSAFLLIFISQYDCSLIYKPPKLDVLLNETATGTYIVYGLTNNGVLVPTLTFPSVWYQDDVTKKLHLSVGIRGQPGWRAAYYFFQDAAYELEPTNSSDPSQEECTKFPDFNYTMEMVGYDDQHLSFVHRATLHEAKENVTCDVYSGQALDGVGPINVIAYLDSATGLYVKLVTLGAIGSQHYSEYYLENRNDSIPASYVFDLPAACTGPDVHIKYFFDKYDIQGKLIKKEESCSIASHKAPLSTLLLLSWMALSTLFVLTL